jgi:hypothetical protein
LTRFNFARFLNHWDACNFSPLLVFPLTASEQGFVSVGRAIMKMSRAFVGCLVGCSMLFSSTGAVAATATAPISQPDPWAVLSVMSGGASAAAVCGAAAAAAAAAQPATGCVLPQVDAPPPVAQTPPPQPIPVPPVESAGAGFGISPLLLGLAAIAAGVGLYLILHNNNNGHANSPA